MKTEVIKTREAIQEYIDTLDRQDLVNLHNEYCQEQGYADDEIYTNDEETIKMFFSNPFKALMAAYCGEYNPNDDFVIFNGYGNLESFNSPEDHVDTGSIINAMLEGDFCPYDIELIDEEEDEESDEEGGENV